MKTVIKKILPWAGLFVIVFSTLAINPQQNPLILTIVICTISLFSLLSAKWLWQQLKYRRHYLAAKPPTCTNSNNTENTKKTFLITGANRGIGLALVKQLTADGHTVFATTRSMQNASELQALTDKILLLDLSQQESITTMVKLLADTTIDVLINNATEGPDTRGINELTIDSIETAFDTNVIGTFRLTQALLPNLRRSHTRKIINISSDLASFTRPNPCILYAYQASKAALNMLTVLLHKELKVDNFTCLLIHPGPVKTRLNPVGIISADESAKALVTVINNSHTKDSGNWLDYCGEVVPW